MRGKVNARGICRPKAIATGSVSMLFQRMTNRRGKASLFREHLFLLLADGLLFEQLRGKMSGMLMGHVLCCQTI